MLPVMIGGYLLGSDAELITFEGGGVGYRRVGAAHAVDPHDPVNASSGVMGYAICGMPVRIWRDEAFDPRAPEAHDRCVAGARPAAPA